MSRKYSISKNNKEKNQKKSSQVDKVYKKTKASKLYLASVFTFLTLLVMIIFSPLVLEKDYDYTTVKLNDPQNISSTLNLVVDDIEINRETGLFKLILRFKNENDVKSLSNIKTEYKLNYITNKGKNEVKTKVIKLSDEYTVIYYEGLPKNFGVISVTVQPRYVYPELESSNDLKEKEIKFYVVDKDLKDNPKLQIQTTSELKKENFDYQIKAVNEDISKVKEDIKKLQLANELSRKDIKKAEDKLEFETADEQVDTKNEISSLKNSITNNNDQIEELEQTIKGYEEKIKQLKENKEDFN